MSTFIGVYECKKALNFTSKNVIGGTDCQKQIEYYFLQQKKAAPVRAATFRLSHTASIKSMLMLGLSQR